MNKLQQEINSFHNQKCSYKSTSDTDCLCSLAYWLYIYGDKELALKICEIAHGVSFHSNLEIGIVVFKIFTGWKFV